MIGTVYLVGAGPGDPELLTLKALRTLEGADVVLHDRLVSDAVLGLIPSRARRIPVGKIPGITSQDDVQRRILWLMAAHARRGRQVVRLKGGDPFVYGRGGEEWAHLAAEGVPVEVVPGISSALAVPALCGIPLTHRGMAGSFAVVTGHLADGSTSDCDRYAGVDTLVVLMGVAHRVEIARRLVAAGRPATQPVAFITAGTGPDQTTVISTLGDVAADRVEVDPPAVMVAGEVVRLHGILRAEPPGAEPADLPVSSSMGPAHAVPTRKAR